MTPKKGGIKDKLNAAMERMNAGRQAKLTAKSEVSYDQGNLKKGAKLDMRSKKVALRSEKRQAINDAKMNMKMGKMPKLMMKSTSTPMNRPQNGELNFNGSNKYIPKEMKKTIQTYRKGKG